MRNSIFIVLILLTACGKSESGVIENIKKRGVVLAGNRVETPNYGLINPVTNDYEGLEIDLSKIIAERILGDEGKLRIRPVTAQTLLGALDDDRVDFVLCCYSPNAERLKKMEFSDAYCTDHIAFLIRKSDTLTTFEGLNGKSVGVSVGISAATIVPRIAGEKGVDVTMAEYPDNAAAKGALKAGEVFAMSTWGANLFGYLDEEIKFSDVYENPGVFGIVIKKNNFEMLDFINNVLDEIKADGTLKKLLDKWGAKLL